MFAVPLPKLLARLALASCFLGFGIWELVMPNLWTGYLPEALQNFHPLLLIVAHGAALTIAALGVLSGYFERFFIGLSVLLLFDICLEILLQEGFTDVLIRDIALLLFTTAMFADTWTRKSG